MVLAELGLHWLIVLALGWKMLGFWAFVGILGVCWNFGGIFVLSVLGNVGILGVCALFPDFPRGWSSQGSSLPLPALFSPP